MTDKKKPAAPAQAKTAPKAETYQRPAPQPLGLGTKETVYKLKGSRLHAGETKIRWWYACIEEGTPYEELFKREYWDVHGWKFEPGDMIRCEPDEQHYTADLKVIQAGVGGVYIEEYFKKEWASGTTPQKLADQYRVGYGGPHHKWRVQRISDNHVEVSGLATEAEANRWLADNLKALAKSARKAA